MPPLLPRVVHRPVSAAKRDEFAQLYTAPAVPGNSTTVSNDRTHVYTPPAQHIYIQASIFVFLMFCFFFLGGLYFLFYIQNVTTSRRRFCVFWRSEITSKMFHLIFNKKCLHVCVLYMPPRLFHVNFHIPSPPPLSSSLFCRLYSLLSHITHVIQSNDLLSLWGKKRRGRETTGRWFLFFSFSS